LATDRDHLLAAIVAEPGDDLPRLAFADWLQENGEAERGEFIRLQIQLARETGSPPRTSTEKYCYDQRRADLCIHGREDLLPLLDRCRELWAQFADGWLAELPAPVKEAVFSRGFPFRIEMSRTAFVEHGAELLEVLPVERLHLKDFHDKPAQSPRPNTEGLAEEAQRQAFHQWFDENRNADNTADRMPGILALAACPHLARVRRLDVSLNRLNADNVAALLASVNLGELTELSFGSDAIGPHGAQAIAGCSKLSKLQSLGLWFSAIGPTGAAAIARSPHLRELRELQLYANQLGDVGVRTLAAASFPNLTTLVLGYNGIGVGGLQALANSQTLPKLSDLDIRANRFGNAGCQVLADSPLADRLTKLRIATNNLTASGVRWLTSARYAGLTELDLEGQDGFPSSVGPGGAEALGASPHLNKLTHLVLKQTELGDGGVAALASGSGLTGLRDLNLEKNEIGPAGMRAFAAAEKFGSLRQLTLEENPIGPEGAAALAASPHFTELRSLNLEDCGIGDEGLFALMRSAWFAKLVKLDLIGNGLTDRAVVALVRSPLLEHLVEFDVPYGIGDEIALALAASPNAANLRRLSIGENLTDTGCRALAASPYLDRLETLLLTENENTTAAGRLPLWRRFGSRLVFGGKKQDQDEREAAEQRQPSTGATAN
jgi:uncharacterized protein (TIGR02996 family)